MSWSKMEDDTENNLLKKVHIDKKYGIIQKIGEGGFGEVHLVEDKQDHKQYVVKAIHGRTREETEWAKKEIQFLKKLRHPNIVLYMEDFEYPRGVIVIMEYCSGGDLAKLIKSRSACRNFFQEETVTEWLYQICLALQYLHSKNILHRDLKPANIFIAEGNVIKLGDFGVSRQLVSQVDWATTVVGTPLYISPEMQRQEPYNHKCDVWSAGCSIYEMMAFRPAIDPMMVYITQQWKVNEMPNNYSQGLCDVIRSMLTVDAAARPSIDEILSSQVLELHQESLKSRPDAVINEELSKPDKEMLPKPFEEVGDKSGEKTPVNSDSEEELDDFVQYSLDDVSDITMRPSYYTTQDPSGTCMGNGPKPSAKDRLAELGYKLNENRQLVSVETGEPFQYDVNNGDMKANEKRYQEIAMVVNEYVGDLLEIELKMSRVTLPVDCTDGEPFTFIYATPDFLMNRDKLLILVGGGNGIRAGVWSRKVVINDSLEAGSQMPVIRQAIKEGYSIIILNPNQNDIQVDGVSIKVRENFDARHHALCVWDSIIIKNTRVRHIAFLTHSEGGRIIVQLAIEREEYFRRLVFAVAFCNSRHDDLLSSAPRSVTEFFNSHSRNWIVSNRPLNESLSKTGGLFPRKDFRKVSAGEQRPEWTVATAKESIFAYLDEEYRKVANPGH